MLPLPEIAFSAAQAYRRLYRVDGQPGHVARAVELYKVYLAQVKTGGRVGDAADSLGELERELERLRARGVATPAAPATPAERTRLGVNVVFTDRAAEAGALREVGDALGDGGAGAARVTIDGAPVEPFALIDVAPGEHAIAVAADGYRAVAKRHRAVQGATSLVEVELAPLPARVTVRAEAGARISVDGRAASTAASAPAPLELSAGRHLIAVERRGREPFVAELTVARGQALALDAPLAMTARRRAVPWVLGGAGTLAAAAVAAAALAVVHDGRAEDHRAALAAGDRLPGVGDAYERAVARRDRYRTASWLAGGGALVAGAAGIFLYYGDTPSAAGVRVAPVASSTGGGVAAWGRF